jgi:hypothetical protein
MFLYLPDLACKHLLRGAKRNLCLCALSSSREQTGHPNGGRQIIATEQIQRGITGLFVSTSKAFKLALIAEMVQVELHVCIVFSPFASVERHGHATDTAK